MAKQVRWHYTVVGQGQFPFDMLRYDQAWPEDAGHSMTERRYEDPATRLPREQKLIGLATPTVDRWASFGWFVKADTIRKVTL